MKNRLLLGSLIAALNLLFLSQASAAFFSDNFDSGASAQWQNNIGAWTDLGGVYAATAPGNFPNAHSALPFNLTDFAIDVDLAGIGDGGIWLRSAAAGPIVGRTGVLLVANGSTLYWHDVTNPSTYGSAHAVVGGLTSNAHIRVEVSGNTYSAFVNGSILPTTTYTTANFPAGQVALYSNTQSLTFDNVVIQAPTPIPEATTFTSWILLGLTGLGTVWYRRRR